MSDSEDLDFLDDDASEELVSNIPPAKESKKPVITERKEVQEVKTSPEEVRGNSKVVAKAESENEEEGTVSTMSKSEESSEIQQQTEEDKRSVFVQNVEYCTTKEELIEIFKGCGKIQKVTIPQSRFGQGKGFAYIQFAEIESVENAMSVQDSIHRGRAIKVIPKRTNQHGFKKKPSTSNGTNNFKSGGGGPFPFMKNNYQKGFQFNNSSSYGQKKRFNPH